jgi:hypothetical protein
MASNANGFRGFGKTAIEVMERFLERILNLWTDPLGYRIFLSEKE